LYSEKKTMFETIWKGLTGRWGMLALIIAATPTGRKLAKTAVKELVRAGVNAGEKVKEITSELREEGSDIIAELREEKAKDGDQTAKNGKSKKEQAST
jgi:hypothetical protein